MKNLPLLILLLLPTWVWGCNCDLCNNKALKSLDTQYNFYTTHQLKPWRDSVTYTRVFTAGSNYQLSIYLAYQDARSYRAKKNRPNLFRVKVIYSPTFSKFYDLEEKEKTLLKTVAEFSWEEGKGYGQGKFNYHCEVTGIYYLQFFPKGSCGYAVLGYNEGNSWHLNIAEEGEVDSEIYSFKTNIRGAIVLKYGADTSWEKEIMVTGRINEELAQEIKEAIRQKYQIRVNVKVRYGARSP